jgi:ABC-type lipoprotein release transport system permease subunit
MTAIFSIVDPLIIRPLPTRFLRTPLFEIQPMDPVTLTLVGATLGAVALAACLIPAIRAIRIEPVSALRSD